MPSHESDVMSRSRALRVTLVSRTEWAPSMSPAGQNRPSALTASETAIPSLANDRGGLPQSWRRRPPHLPICFTSSFMLAASLLHLPVGGTSRSRAVRRARTLVANPPRRTARKSSSGGEMLFLLTLFISLLRLMPRFSQRCGPDPPLPDPSASSTPWSSMYGRGRKQQHGSRAAAR